MLEINEILSKFILKKELTEQEKFKILRSKRIDTKVVEYLMSKLNHLHIEVLGEYEGSLFELMSVGELEGWCWQTTESAIVFLNDDDYIERGNLRFDERTPEYYHSWICFKFEGTEYVLDPCLSLLCKKSDYLEIFEIDVKGKVSAKAVREELISQVTAPKKKEVIVHGPEDVNTPLYRNGAGYKTKIDKGKIKKLTVHYYSEG